MKGRVASLVLAALVLGSVVWVWRTPPQALSNPRVREEVTEVEPGGTSFVRIGADFDAYTWMRAARNLLATGDPCDARVKGVCRDTKVLGPGGIRWEYAENLHVHAIAWVVRAARVFKQEIPLGAAPSVVALIVALVGTLAAFAFGWRHGGAACALTAAFLPALQPVFMVRGRSGDNDCWQFALPMLGALALAESFRTRDPRRIALAASLAGVTTALCAWTWSGWVFFQCIWVIALLGTLAVELVTERSARRGGLRFAVYLVVSTGGALLATGGEAFFQAFARATGEAGSAPALAWPSAFIFVSELRPTQLTDVAASIGGWACLALAAAGVVSSGARALGGDQKSAAPGVPILVGVWLVATVIVGARGTRFLQFVGPPVALGWALLVESELKELERRTGWRLAAFAWAVAALLQAPVVKNGIGAAESMELGMSRAWWDSLTALRTTAAPNAIVHTWWDYGYWVKYLADRRVSTDGGTLGTHAVHWLSRALLAPEAESLGTLRMLGCGADATPLPEGGSGALALATRAARDELDGYRLLRSLLPLDLPTARAELRRRGVDGALSDQLLNSSHCTPPESYLVLSSREVVVAPWIYFGGYDIPAANALALLRARGPEFARDRLQHPSDFSPGEASRLVRAASEAIEHGTLEDFVTIPTKTFLHADPLPCVVGPSGDLECQSPDGQAAIYAPRGKPPRVRILGQEGIPALTVSVDDSARTETAHRAATLPDTAAVIDRSRDRAWIVPLALARSTFVSLMFLDARHSAGFEKVSEKISDVGNGFERVATFRARWPGRR